MSQCSLKLLNPAYPTLGQSIPLRHIIKILQFYLLYIIFEQQLFKYTNYVESIPYKQKTNTVKIKVFIKSLKEKCY